MPIRTTGAIRTVAEESAGPPHLSIGCAAGLNEDESQAAVCDGRADHSSSVQDMAEKHVDRPTTGPVLLVDDEPSVLDVMRQALDLAGYDSVMAVSVSEAVAVAESCNPAIVVTDLLLPDGTGMELVARLRERWPKLAAVLVSGACDDDELVTAIRQYGAVEYLKKPFGLNDLNRAVGRALETE